jgi:hypothetical protein
MLFQPGPVQRDIVHFAGTVRVNNVSRVTPALNFST